MKIGMSSASFYPEVLTEKSIGIMKNLGFDLGEVFLNSPFEYEEDFAKKLVEEKHKYNFDVISIHSFSSSFEPYIFDRYKRRRKDMIEIFKKVVNAANLIGARYYTFHGLRLESFENLDIKSIIEIYNEICYIALEKGIKLAQENVSWCMGSNIEFLDVLKEKCEFPIYFTLDIKQAYRAGKDPLNYIECMGDRLTNIHINDKNDEKTCLLPGKGNVNYEKIVNKLKEINYDKDVIIEVYRENYINYEEIYEAKKYLQKFFEN